MSRGVEDLGSLISVPFWPSEYPVHVRFQPANGYPESNTEFLPKIVRVFGFLGAMAMICSMMSVAAAHTILTEINASPRPQR